MDRLFVYGTLRRPVGGPAGDTFYHHRIAQEVSEAEYGWLDGAELFDCGAFPAIGPGNGRVRGEVLTVSSGAFAEADIIEGHPDFYERRVETITCDDGTSVDAWVYWAPSSLLTEGQRRIVSGDWFDRERQVSFPEILALPDDASVSRAFDRLASEKLTWLSTVRTNGRPHLVPMWHAVIGNRIYFVTPSTAIKVDNIAREPYVSVSLPDAEDVVIVDGWAIEATHLLDLVASFFVDRYGWDPSADAGDSPTQVVIEVTPRVLRAWSGDYDHQRWTL